MGKPTSVLKNKVADWIKITSVNLIDTVENGEQKSDKVEWQFVIGKSLHVTLMKNRDDRIDLLMAVKYEEKPAKNLVVGSEPLENLLTVLNPFVTTNGLKIKWIVEKGVITGYNLTGYIDVEELDRPRFFKLWDLIIDVNGHVQLMLNKLANPNQTQSQTTTDSSSSSMYQ